MLLNIFLFAIIPTMFVTVGFVFFKFPPPKINSTSGWRTKQATQSQATWDFANKLGGKCMLILGIIEFLINSLILITTSRIDPNVISELVPLIAIVQAACIIIVCIYVEYELKKHFR